MPAPITTASALAGTRAGRRVVIGVMIAALVLGSIVATPVVAIPFIAAGVTAAVPAANAARDLPAASGDWTYPLTGGYSKGRGFGYNPVLGCSYCSTDHQGYDMAQGCGATIHAAGPGKVITAGAFQGYGNTVRIDHGSGLITLYGHMQWNSLTVTVGESVTAGTPLGAEGNTGRSFGCHLHFEVQQAGAPLDPQPFMAARGLPLT